MPLYFISAPSVGLIKIGFATDVAKRFSMVCVHSPVPVEMVGIMDGTRNDEWRLHDRFTHLRRRGEWFEDTPEIRALARPFVITRANRKKHPINALGLWLKAKGQLPAHFADEIGLAQPEVWRACVGKRVSDRVWERITAATNGEITRALVEAA